VRTLIFALLGFGSTTLFAEEVEKRWQLHTYIGGAQFPGSEWHVAPGFGLGYRVTRRLSVTGEFSYLYACECDQDATAIAKVFYELRDRNRGVVPYLTGGIGAFWHRQSSSFWSSSTWAGGGGGVLIPVGERIRLAPEFLAAWPTSVQFGARVELEW
jgi:hypothetical protein